MKKRILSFSGGKDSTYLGEILDYDEAVLFDTGWEFPEMYAHIERFRKRVESCGIKFTVLKPEFSFDYLMFEKPVQERRGGTHNGYSWCGLCGCRWGTTEKLKALDDYAKDSGAIVLVGIAADETHRLERERAPYKRFPLVEMGITEADCLQGCYNLGYDWGGLYEHLDRVSCKYCALKNLKELRNIRKYYPDVWEELKERQKLTSRPYKGKGQSVFQLDARFAFEEERVVKRLSITNREFFNELKERLEYIS